MTGATATVMTGTIGMTATTGGIVIATMAIMAIMAVIATEVEVDRDRYYDGDFVT